MFYLGGVGLSLFLTLLLLSKKAKTLGDKILASWLFIVTTHLLLFYFRKMWLYPQLMGIEIPFPLVHGPFLYLYTLALTNRISSLKLALLHFIPALASFLYAIPFLLLPVDQKIYVYQNNGAGYETFSLIKYVAIVVSGVVYVILSGIIVSKHRKSIVNEFSNADKINLQWLQYLIYWISLIWLLVFFTNDDWIFVGAVFFVAFIGFFGIRQVGVFHSQINEPSKPVTTESETSPEKKKYQKSGLNEISSEELHLQLTQLMNDKKLYCENDLTLAELARHLNAQPNHLSQVINEREGKNFYDYINSLRIEEFKRLASSPENRRYTLLALAQQCGFNSKSTFNRYFKNVTGLSPSEFVSAAVVSEN